ncbi:MAG TPA: acetyl-CoA decarbonylase/synthase complex subunit delta [Armatimonadetes bacterium]|nr:acetyl-CoA decarbonylase/synthase complex subunit delta [Armatimonadota bacterium]
MQLEIPKESYTGNIKQVVIGTGDNAVTVGGESCLPFYIFEGAVPNPPRIAIDVYDYPPDNWPPAIVEPYADVLNDPVAWARKCVDAYGAEMICLQLASTDPYGLDKPSEDAVETVKAVADAIEVPLIIWGCGNEDKDMETLRMVCEACEGKNVVIAPVVEKTYTRLGAQAIAYHQIAAASTPIDINLAKQLNILLRNLGVPDEQIIMDPTTGGLGYGIEYTYSVMERIRLAALVHEDEQLAFPMICNLAKEVWSVKEAKLSEQEAPLMGDPKQRGILMEAITAALLMLAGADILVMRHPEAIRLIREVIDELTAT